MTDKDIIKALECCACETIMYCEDQCPFYERCMKDEQLSKYALALINRQQAEIADEKAKKVICADVIRHQKEEIERLEKETECFADIGKMYSEIRAEVRAEAVKEFAERLKAVSHPYADTQMVFELQIDNLVKEMVGEG